MDGLNSFGDSVEGLYNGAKKTAGGAVDGMAHVVGDGLDLVGLHSAAHDVDGAGDWFADGMGADVPEMQLAEAKDPSDLIHGSPKAIRDAATHLEKFAAAFEETGQGLQRLDAQHWKGTAADRFREKFAPHPKKWLTAADACRLASETLVGYAHTVQWAQEQARQALELYTAAAKKSVAARLAYNQQVDQYNTYLRLGIAPDTSGKGPQKPGPFHDPGEAGIAAAQEKVNEARRQRDAEGDEALRHLGAALERAPVKPSFAHRMADDYVDTMAAETFGIEHFSMGVLGAGADMLKFVRGVNPFDTYNLTHPAMWLAHTNAVDAGLLHAGNHPVDLVKSLVGSGWGSDPGDASGRFSFNVLLGVATDGVSTTETAPVDIAEKATQSASENSVKEFTGNAVTEPPLEPSETPPASEQIEEPRDYARDSDAKTELGDPIDVATGRMTLAQRDVVLHGALPLLFTRTFESGYRIGRWMGPSWACTLDQRLEFDIDRIVLVREDGVVLAYPHPGADEAVLPVEGPRWPLRREGDRYTVTDPRAGHTRTFSVHDDALALLTELTDRHGHRITFAYDETGAPTAIRHDAGYDLRVCTAAGRVTSLALVGGAADGSDLTLVRYRYTGGRLTDVFNSSWTALRFGYDDAGRITSWTDRNGSHYVYTYDELGRCIHQSGDDGVLAYSFDYEELDEETGLAVTAVTNSLGHTSRYLINDARQIVAEVDPLGAVTRSEWDRYDRLLSRTDPLGRTIRFRYDEDGNRIGSTRPDGLEAVTTYNELGLPETLTAPDGATRHWEYDDTGNPLSLTDPSGATTRYTYDESGHLTTVTDTLGSTTAIRRNAAAQPTATTDALGATTHYTYDAFGRTASVTDDAGHVTRMEWTVEGRLSRRISPDGSSERWVYDGEGNLIEHTTADGGRTRYEYTHFNKLAAQTSPDGARHEFTYDTELRLTCVTNPQGLTWTYSYDAAGRLISETDFNGRELTYRHDPASQLIARRNALGQQVTYRYNELGRLIAKDADGAVTTFEYDRAGRLLTAHGPDAELSYQRDILGRVTAETSNGRTLRHEYALGRRTRRSTPAGAATTWHYDAAGRCTTLETAGRSLTLEYDTTGREIARRIGDTLTLSQNWDVNGRLVGQHLTTPDRVVHRRQYTYRCDGNLTGIEDELSGPRTFDLDEVGRVTAVHAPGWSERYAYDSVGNITDADWPTTHAAPEALGARSYTGTLINRAGGVRYEHDAQGRVVLRQKTRLSRKPDTWRYTWDAEDRLTAVTTPDGQHWQYRYDPLGRRIAKERLSDNTDALERTEFIWDGHTLAEQTTHAPELTRPVSLTWDYHGLQPVSQTERITAHNAPQEDIDQRFFAIITDLIGTPCELVDETGTIAWHTRSTLWGNTAWAVDSTTYTPLRFPGQYFDPETQLHYNVHRYYDPETARYTTPDPLGLTPAPNPHAYVLNPTTWADVLGLSPSEAKPTGTAPAFVVDSQGLVQDVRDIGRPDNQLVFSGHGHIFAGDGTAVTVPENTWVHMYSEHGVNINNGLGWKIETGDPSITPMEVYGPGEKLPDYYLSWGDDIGAKGMPRTVTVTDFTRLSELLRPNMGRVHWAACRGVILD